MTKANDLHNQAMEHFDDAFFARKRGDEQAALQSFEQALAKETAAIDALEERERVQMVLRAISKCSCTGP